MSSRAELLENNPHYRAGMTLFLRWQRGMTDEPLDCVVNLRELAHLQAQAWLKIRESTDYAEKLNELRKISKDVLEDLEKRGEPPNEYNEFKRRLGKLLRVPPGVE